MKSLEDRESRGAISLLADVVGAELLDGVKQYIQRVWVKTFGLQLIRKQLPLAWAKWETDERRSQLGALPLFLYSWFVNKQKELGNEPKENPAVMRKGRWRDTGEDCRQAYFQNKPMGCAVHASNEVCAIERREN